MSTKKIVFAESKKDSHSKNDKPKWKVIIADDEKEIHSVTRLIFKNYQFEDSGIELISAYNGEETKEMLKNHLDCAVILLDVVMENDYTGLEIVKYIREVLNNKNLQIIIRTGQPGTAPEDEIIFKYDINDYKSKSELTSQKMITSLTTALRTFHNIRLLEQQRQGIEKILDTAPELFSKTSLSQYCALLIEKIFEIISYNTGISKDKLSGLMATMVREEFFIIVGNGDYADSSGKPIGKMDDEAAKGLIQKTSAANSGFIENNQLTGCFPTEHGMVNIVYVKGFAHLSKFGEHLIKLLFVYAKVALENIYIINKLKIAADKAEEAGHLKSELLTMLTLDLRAPIQLIGSYSQLLLTNSALPLELKKYAESINNSVEEIKSKMGSFFLNDENHKNI